MRRGLLAVVLLSSACAVHPVRPQGDMIVEEPGQAPAEAAAPAAPAQPQLAYPATRRGDVVETQFGVKLADPYRWLESDVRSDADVRAWVDQQNAVTNAFLGTLPGRLARRASRPAISFFWVLPLPLTLTYASQYGPMSQPQTVP